MQELFTKILLFIFLKNWKLGVIMANGNPDSYREKSCLKKIHLNRLNSVISSLSRYELSIFYFENN